MSFIELKTGAVNDPILLLVKGKAVRDPTGSGKKMDWKWLFVPVGVMIAGLIAAAIFLPKPSDTDGYRDQLEEDFIREGMTIYQTVENRLAADPYAGWLQADGELLWFIGSAPEHPGGDSYNRGDAVWSGFYTDSEWLKEITLGFSPDASRLDCSSGSISISENSDRRIYMGENTLLYYEGGDPEVYAVLEKLFGEPIADGRLENDSE